MAACDDDDLIYYDDDYAAPPENLAGWYYNQAVYLTWELGSGWDDDPFRVYGKRISDAGYYLIAEVTNCSGGLCSYTDVNILPEHHLRVLRGSRESQWSGDRFGLGGGSFCPDPDPPPDPASVEVVALDNANYIRWTDNARNAQDFSFYRVYLARAGETTSSWVRRTRRGSWTSWP